MRLRLALACFAGLIAADIAKAADPLADKLIRESVRPTLIGFNEAAAIRFVFGDDPPSHAVANQIRRQAGQFELCSAYMLTTADQSVGPGLAELSLKLLALRTQQKTIAASIDIPDVPGAAAEWLAGSILAGATYRDSREAEQFQVPRIKGSGRTLI